MVISDHRPCPRHHPTKHPTAFQERVLGLDKSSFARARWVLLPVCVRRKDPAAVAPQAGIFVEPHDAGKATDGYGTSRTHHKSVRFVGEHYEVHKVPHHGVPLCRSEEAIVNGFLTNVLGMMGPVIVVTDPEELPVLHVDGIQRDVQDGVDIHVYTAVEVKYGVPQEITFLDVEKKGLFEEGSPSGQLREVEQRKTVAEAPQPVLVAGVQRFDPLYVFCESCWRLSVEILLVQPNLMDQSRDPFTCTHDLQGLGLPKKKSLLLSRSRSARKMNTLTIGAFYINMDKDTKRRRRVMGELMKLNMPVHRVPAVNGRELSGAERRSLTTWACHRFCTPSMVGCAASHLKAWRTFMDSGFTHAVICEDDIVIQPGAKQRILSAISEIHDNFDILYGGCLHCDPDPGMSWSVTFFNLVTGGKMGNKGARKISSTVYIPHMALGTHFYVVNRKSASRLIEILRRGIDFHVDVQLNRHFRELKVYAMHPPIAHQHFDGDSNNVSDTYPTALNSLVAGWQEGGIPGTYLMSAPAGQVGPLVLNGWLLICGIIAITLGLLDRSGTLPSPPPSAPSLLIFLLLLALTVPDMIHHTMSGHWPLPAVTGLLFLAARKV